MPKGHSELPARIVDLETRADDYLERLAKLEDLVEHLQRRLTQANEYFAKGYIPPSV